MSFRKDRDREDDLAKELQNHLDLEAEERLAAGAKPAEAREAALRAFGNPTRVKEEVRTVWTWTTVETAIRDFRFALRLLLKSPAFSVVAILTLALGIGANTAIFTVVNALMLKPLPYKDASNIVVLSTIFQRQNSDRGSVSYPDILDWKAQTGLFEAVAPFTQANFDITSGDEPERIRGLAVDREYFRVLSDPPFLGRTFEPYEDAPKANRVVVLSHALWMRRFGGDTKVLNSTIELGGEPHKIVGVMPRNATWPDDAQIFKPLGVGPTPSPDTLRRDNHVFRVVARMKAGVPIEQAQAQLTTMGARVARENTNRAQTNWKIHPLREFIIGPALGRTLWILLGAVVVVLLIACVNVANLLLARGAAREREVSIRNALGAGRSRIAGQFLIESLVLAIAGGLLGIVLGYAGAAALVHYAPEGVPRLDSVAVDGTVLSYTILLCLLTAVIFGVAPVLHVLRSAPASGIREGGRASSASRHATRLRSVLVVSELALAVILMAAAGLLVRSFNTLQKVDPGFSTRNVLTLQVALPRSRYGATPQVLQAFDTMIDKIRQVPGVTSASAIASLPVGGGGFYLGRVFLTTGQPEPPASKDTSALWSVVRPEAFQTLDIPVVAGRSFTRSDTTGSNPVVIVSQSMAKQMFGKESPLGRRIRSWRDENVYREVVGITADIRYAGLGEDIVNVAYVPHAQSPWQTLMLVVRSDRDPRTLLKSIQSQIWSLDRRLAVAEVKTMDQIIQTELARPRFSMFLLAVFAATALLMAAIGIYGLMSYSVAQQTKEIGIRMALGALRWDILKNVTGRALALALIGVAIGMAGALAVTRLMTTILFGVSPTDSATFAAASGLLIGVAVIAAYIPARRASHLDPLIALRYE
jgi:putative ABC transport system permease protein